MKNSAYACSLYAAFDQFPSQKGAAHHINRFAPILFNICKPGLLYVIGGDNVPSYQEEDSNTIIRFSEKIPNFLERTIAYGKELCTILDTYRKHLRITHFRDPFSGIPILALKERSYKTIYEINGLPSIELPYTYRSLSSETIAKLQRLEQFCMSRCDCIITISDTLKQYLLSLSVPEHKIMVLPNGADPFTSYKKPEEAPKRYILYFGALQSWQGVDILLHAFKQLSDIKSLFLVICSSVRKRGNKPFEKLAEKLGIGNKIIWLNQLHETPLRSWLSHASLTVAPLKETTRNMLQGCSPLKILESMAAGVPVVASDIPCVREIMTDGDHGFLVRPDRPHELSRSIRVLLEYPQQCIEMGKKAKEHIRQSFSWKVTTDRLAECYRQLLDSKSL